MTHRRGAGRQAGLVSEDTLHIPLRGTWEAHRRGTVVQSVVNPPLAALCTEEL